MISLKRIAQICGVSEATVSKALRDMPGVKTETRSRILEVAKQFDYHPNALVKSIQKGFSHTIGIACSRFDDMFGGAVMQGIMCALHAHGQQALAMSWDIGVENHLDMIRIFAEHRVDGIIVFPPQKKPSLECIEKLNNFFRPVVAIDQEWRGARFDCVQSDDFLGGELAAKALLELGHTRIANFHFEENSTGRRRLDGFRHAMAAQGVPVLSDLLIDTEGRKELAYGKARELLSGEETKRPTAILCFNDIIAARVVAAAWDSGLSVPDDLSVVGYCDLELASEIRPSLTTISQNPKRMGGESVELLQKRLNSTLDMKKNPIAMTLPVNLVERGSTIRLTK